MKRLFLVSASLFICASCQAQTVTYPIGSTPLFLSTQVGANINSSPGNWVPTWDGPGAFTSLNPLQVISPNGSRAASFYSRQSDYVSGQGIFSPETMVILTLMDQAPPPNNVGTWGTYIEYDQSWTGNGSLLNIENGLYTKTNGFLAAISSDPYYNGFQVTGTPSYAGSTLTISNVASFAGRPPTPGTYVFISGITGTGGVNNPNAFWPIATVVGTGPYTLTFTIAGITGTPGGTALLTVSGHSSNYRIECGAGRVGGNACSTGMEIIQNNSVYETGMLIGVNALDLTTPTVNSATHSSGVVTLNYTASPAWSTSGTQITVTGATGDTTINGTFPITGSTATTVTYAVAGSGSPTGTITATRQSAPGYAMPEQVAVSWSGSAGNHFADIFELTSGGFPQLHVALPQANSSISFEYQGQQELVFNSANTMYGPPDNSYNLGAASVYFKGEYVYTQYLKPVTIAALPTCNAAAKGAIAFVSDTVANAAATYHGAVTGGGATTVNSPVSCTGAAWQYD